QGFHEIAAVMLLICMDGTWTSGAENAQAASTSKEVVNSDDLEVYRELGDAAAVPADAYALFDALLSVHRLGEMYEVDSTGQSEDWEPPAAFRCRRITRGLRRIAPDLAVQVESWGLAPQ
ncbi:unnamed protein product, partial [Polarella glacialis]